MKESDFLDENAVIIERLKELPILENFEEKYIKGLMPLSKVKEYEPGEMIINEGDEDNCIYFLLSGRVRVFKNGIDICYLGRSGDVFGEMAVIEQEARSASVEAVNTTLCLSVDTTYKDMMGESDKVSFMYILYRLFSKLLAERLRKTTDEFIEAKKEIAQLKGNN